MFFFFKQKTAYEMTSSLVGSEMCIRDRYSFTLALAIDHDSVSEMSFALNSPCTGDLCGVVVQVKLFFGLMLR